jgi:carboxyl-terminal processing protease
MTSRTRVAVLLVSLPVLAFAVVGGVLGRTASAQGESYRYLRIFQDVVTLILDNYVEPVEIDKVMHGAMHGLADGLDPDSAYLDAAQMKSLGQSGGDAAHPGLELTRQYYLRVIAARDGSPAAKAGLRPGDYVRSIDGQSTRDTTVFEGMRMLRGKAGSKVKLAILRGNAAEPHEVELTREAPSAAPVRGRVAGPGTGVLRIAEFTRTTAGEVKNEIGALTRNGAARVVIDLRGTATGDLDAGFDVARLFVASGVLGYRQGRGEEKLAVNAAAGDGAVTVPVAILADNGTSGAAEVFAAALAGNKRATVVGDRSQGRAGRQKVVPLPDGAGLMLTHLLYLGPGGAALQERGVTPDVAVDVPTVDFGVEPPAGDAALDKAVEALTAVKKAA